MQRGALVAGSVTPRGACQRTRMCVLRGARLRLAQAPSPTCRACLSRAAACATSRPSAQPACTHAPPSLTRPLFPSLCVLRACAMRRARWRGASSLTAACACSPLSGRAHAARREGGGEDHSNHHHSAGCGSACACVSGSERTPDLSDRARLVAGPPRPSRPIAQVHRHAPGGGGRGGGHCNCHVYTMHNNECGWPARNIT